MAEFKSSSMEAENESSAVGAVAGGISAAMSVAISSTNLPVVNNIQDVNTRLNACNESYKNLLKSHSESISKLGQEFDTFDKDLSDHMELVQE